MDWFWHLFCTRDSVIFCLLWVQPWPDILLFIIMLLMHLYPPSHTSCCKICSDLSEPFYAKIIFFSSVVVICLSFWAEVHYNSIYPEGGKFVLHSFFSVKQNGSSYLPSVTCISAELWGGRWIRLFNNYNELSEPFLVGPYPLSVIFLMCRVPNLWN